MNVSLITSAHIESPGDEAKAVKRITDVVSSHPHCELIVIDTSPQSSKAVKSLVHYRGVYKWCDGYNILYGGSLNLAVRIASGEALVYFSARHGRQFDPTWLDDIIEPLHDPKCGMAGSIQPCDWMPIHSPDRDRDTTGLPAIHVQGGIWAARLEIMQQFPYSPYFWQVYSDVWHSWRLQKSGYSLIDVPTIRAVAGGAIPMRHTYKYVVDYSTDDD